MAELAKNTNGGLTTVKKCIFQTMEYGMIIEGDTADSTGEKKAKQYLINEKYQYFLFFMIDNDNLIVKTYNFNLKCVNHYSVNFKLKKFYEIICSNIDRMKEKYDIGTICLSLPCVVNGGIVLDWYYNSNLNRFNLKSALINKYHLNTIIQNDMQLTVIGESAEIRRNTKNIITVQFGHNGIGVGEMANGRLLEGNSGFAGEVGYINNLRKNIMEFLTPLKL